MLGTIAKKAARIVAAAQKRMGTTQRMSKKTRITVLLATLGILVACASADYDASSLPADVAARPLEYEIGPGDSLQIFVWDHEDLSTTVEVRPDGKISTPLVEDLQAAGKTATGLARDIEGVLSEYVRSPVVTVIMQSFAGSAQQQVRVVGQAVEPRAIQYRQGMTVLDVVIAVGGLSEFAAGNKAKVVRKVEGRTVEIAVRLDDLLNDGRMEENVRMLPGDVLIIPESFF
jgi:polysaccharide export outer membrane protein